MQRSVYQHQQKFISPPTANRVIFAYSQTDLFRQDHQHKIAGIVAVFIIDLLEIIHIDHHQRKWLVIIFHALFLLFKQLHHHAAVNQIGQRICVGQCHQLLVGIHHFCLRRDLFAFKRIGFHDQQDTGNAQINDEKDVPTIHSTLPAY
ncbi:hypothetical protein SDC9_185328 [bioreactor metagenome]|uniref:Uncharacterized protein n=1 Tax=bioreactor metagenome TaxID=1076179 RepID=A0A645HFI8_9ZZZZ